MNKISLTHSAEHSYNYVKSLFRDLCRDTGSTYSKHLFGSDDITIATSSIDPSEYDNPHTFHADYVLSKLLSKWEGLKTNIDTRKVALAAFDKQEDENKVTNKRLRAGTTSIVDPIIHRARRIVANVLGPLDVNKFKGLEDWGPGATTDLRRPHAQLDSKIMSFPIPVSRAAKALLEEAIVNDLHWSYCLLGSFPVGPYRMLDHCFTVSETSKIETVNKDSKTDRTIAIENRGNMFLQKSVGKFFRRCLKRYGINLDDQSKNQQLAALCIKRLLATIDLSMASDSVTIELVWLLLPFDWAHYLDRIRSKSYILHKGDEGTMFEKFSSMGNGFTFELESLIFYAVVKACTEDDTEATVAVYGDDIICDQKYAATVISSLAYLGFKTNANKTYVEGNFFESCGKHYFKGIDVTPIYQKRLLTDDFEVVKLLNRLVRLSLRYSEDPNVHSSPWRKSWEKRIVSLRNSNSLPMIPFGTIGDDGFLVNHIIFTPKRYERSNGYRWPVIRRRAVKVPACDEALLALTLRRGVCTESPFNGELPSRSQQGTVSVKTHSWIEPTWEFALD